MTKDKRLTSVLVLRTGTLRCAQGKRDVSYKMQKSAVRKVRLRSPQENPGQTPQVPAA